MKFLGVCIYNVIMQVFRHFYTQPIMTFSVVFIYNIIMMFLGGCIYRTYNEVVRCFYTLHMMRFFGACIYNL